MYKIHTHTHKYNLYILSLHIYIHIGLFTHMYSLIYGQNGCNCSSMIVDSFIIWVIIVAKNLFTAKFRWTLFISNCNNISTWFEHKYICNNELISLYNSYYSVKFYNFRTLKWTNKMEIPLNFEFLLLEI